MNRAALVLGKSPRASMPRVLRNCSRGAALWELEVLGCDYRPEHAGGVPQKGGERVRAASTLAGMYAIFPGEHRAYRHPATNKHFAIESSHSL